MLDSGHDPKALSDWVAASTCKVELPATWQDFFNETGLTPTYSGDPRRFPRYRAPNKAALEYRQTLPGKPRPSGWHGIYAKDISREGLGFLHSEQLYPRERMRIVLSDGIPRVVEVVHCRRVQRLCYEIGARFVADVKGLPPASRAQTG